jgi:hypothetical protein
MKIDKIWLEPGKLVKFGRMLLERTVALAHGPVQPLPHNHWPRWLGDLGCHSGVGKSRPSAEFNLFPIVSNLFE